MKKICFLLFSVIALASCVKSSDIESLQGQINALKSNQIASVEKQISAINSSISALESQDVQLKNLISTLESEVSQNGTAVASVIEALKKKDTELETKIGDLRKYVDTELKNAKDWVSATFATLAQYNSLVSELSSLRHYVDSSVTALENKLDKKIFDDILAAISASESSIKSWVNERLSGYYTISEMDAKLSALKSGMDSVDAGLGDEIDGVDSRIDDVAADLKDAKTEITEAYQAAIREAIERNNGTIDAKIADEIKKVNDRLDSKVKDIEDRLDDIEDRLSKLEELLGSMSIDNLINRLQSVAVIPQYSDGSVDMRYGYSEPTVVEFIVRPSTFASVIALSASECLSLKVLSTATKSTATFTELDIKSATSNNGILTLSVDPSGLPESFVNDLASASAFLDIKGTSADYATDLFPLNLDVDRNFLCFTAEEANSTISMTQSVGFFGTPELRYRVNNKGSWNAFVPNVTVVKLENVGDKVYFKGNNSTFNTAKGGLQFVLTGRIAASGNIMTLLDETGKSKAIPCDYCFRNLFARCSALTSAPELPAKSLAAGCYSYMFSECTSLTAAPELPAMSIYNSEECYLYMFAGCTNLVNAPDLPSVSVYNSGSCYRGMFYLCTSLVDAPAIAATYFYNSEACFEDMFYGCSSLKNVPDMQIDAISDSPRCFSRMFYGCTSLLEAPEFAPAPSEYEYYSLQIRGEAESCFANTFEGCSSLATTPDLSRITGTYASNMDRFCLSMFSNCKSLTEAPNLPSVSGSSCFRYMFSGCSKLVTAPLIINTTGNWCCAEMFYGCTNLVNAPEEVYVDGDNACSYMFAGCRSLVTAPKTVYASGEYCCEAMFAYCLNLKDAPELPIERISPYCYKFMFYGCTSLVNAPELPAITLAEGCYSYMFRGCTSLEKAPELPGYYLVNGCYEGLFYGCEKINYVSASFIHEYQNGYVLLRQGLDNWLTGVSSTGTFVKNSSSRYTRDDLHLPDGWTIILQ